jgi:hypothetical protein
MGATDPGTDGAARNPAPGELAARLKSTFGVAYLTLTGVTQSVAMAVLAARVEATYEQFDPVHWVLVLNTFLVIVLVWNEYMIAAIAYFWTPTLADAFFPFGLLALQLVAAHTVFPDPRAWFLAVGALLAVGSASFAYGFSRVRRHPEDNSGVLRAIGVHQWLTMVFTGAGGVLAIGIGLLYDVAGLARAGTVFALAGTVITAAMLLRSIPYWNRVTTFAEVRPATRPRRGVGSPLRRIPDRGAPGHAPGEAGATPDTSPADGRRPGQAPAGKPMRSD